MVKTNDVRIGLKYIYTVVSKSDSQPDEKERILIVKHLRITPDVSR